MGIGEPEGLDVVDWYELYERVDSDEAVIAGLAYKGRWTAIAAQAKAGKSTVLLGLAVTCARNGASILYIDAEMGPIDMLDRVEYWMDLKPPDLANLHYCGLPPKLDTVAGCGRLAVTVEELHPDLVILDGLNGVVQGGENDDTTWRDFYEWAVAPLKSRGIAVISADNLGKDATLGPRGSSVKLDKADAIIILERTDQGVKLTASHRRTFAYPAEQHYLVLNADENDPPMTVTRIGESDPEGTSDTIAAIEALGLPVDMPHRKVRAALRASGYKGRNVTIDAAVRARRNRVPRLDDIFEESPVPGVGAHGGTSDKQEGLARAPKFVPQSMGMQVDGTPMDPPLLRRGGGIHLGREFGGHSHPAESGTLPDDLAEQF